MIWQLQTAKARLSEVLRRARDEGPQTITVRGREEFVVLTREAFDDRRPRPSVLDALGPLVGSEIDVSRPETADRAPSRLVNFEEP